MQPRRPEWWRHYFGARLVSAFPCWELYRLVMREEFGFAVTDFGALLAGEDIKSQARRAIADNLDGWRETAWEEGAGVLFREGREPSHVGIATAKRGVLLHAHHDSGVTTLDLAQSPTWRRRLVGCYVPR